MRVADTGCIEEMRKLLLERRALEAQIAALTAQLRAVNEDLAKAEDWIMYERGSA